MILWRISAFPDLTGRGGLLAAGRWHHTGRPVVYLAENPASAMLEVLVHLEIDPEDLPDKLRLMKVEVPETLAINPIQPELPENWIEQESTTQGIGDAWLASMKSVLLRVPSAIMPHTHNWLLNPAHSSAKELSLTIETLRLDQRLFKGTS
ncbi:RES family NAD+ phosphorylase [Alcaligenaceae bacterium]|nr:RES family NAD+ phosphorylase [Alcaligenaceae bacterium]